MATLLRQSGIAKNKSKADIRSRGEKMLVVVAATTNKDLKKKFEFLQAALRSHGDIFAARLIPSPSAPHFPLRHHDMQAWRKFMLLLHLLHGSS